jgi:hypothetical protein
MLNKKITEKHHFLGNGAINAYSIYKTILTLL